MVAFFRRNWFACVIPGVVCAGSFLMKAAAGPYWLSSNLDPSYQYLLNGLYMVKGIAPAHTDHPGTPLQMLCCCVIWVFNAGRPVADVVTRVLISPEFYLNAISVVLVLFFVITTFYLAAYVYAKTDDKIVALMSQLPAIGFLFLPSYAASSAVIPVVANVSPEPLLIGIGNLFGVCFLGWFFAITSPRKLLFSLLLGVVGGLGVAVKLSFIPLLILPVLVLTWKDKILFLVMCCLSFVAWTFPIISVYAAFWKWVIGLLTHTGAYGLGGQGFDLANYFGSWGIIVRQQWLCILLIMAAFVMAYKEFKAGLKKPVSVLTAIAVTVVLQFALVAKHPAQHYLLPGILLCGVLLAILFFICFSRNVLWRKIAWAFMCLLFLTGIVQAGMYYARLVKVTRDIWSFHEQVIQKYAGCVVIGMYRGSGQETALAFANEWRNVHGVEEELAQLYPGKFYFHIWSQRILGFKGRVWSDDILARSFCVLFKGSTFDFSQGPYRVQTLEEGKYESVYRLTGTTEKQATVFFYAARNFFQAGDYEKALSLALQAKTFRYQPAVLVDNLIKIVAPRVKH